MCSKEYLHHGRMANDICERFGKRLKKLRLQKNMKQIDLAVHTGLTRSHISRIENGRAEPGLRSLEILAASFEMSLSQLLSGLK